MLTQKQITINKDKQKSDFITVIHPDNLAEFNKREEGDITKRETNSDRTVLVSWLFLTGSLIFQADGILELTESVSIQAIFHNLASLLFTIGSIFFLLDARHK